MPRDQRHTAEGRVDMTKDGPTGLEAAAAALEAELARFEDLSNTRKKIPLDSGKNLDRAAKATIEATESQERVGARVGARVQAVAQLRDRQDRGQDVLEQVHVRMSAVLDTAQKLTADADAEDVQDISRQGEALRQQQATKNKLSLLQKRIVSQRN
jgi:hypothetical protein